MSFSVLFVCTGNICRSPVAERLFRARVRSSADVVTSSAGTNGLPGWGIDGPSAAALAELGVNPDGHVSRRVTDRMLDEADLVLTATTEHRGLLLRARPSMMARIFTLREFVRLADGAPAGSAALAARVRVIADRRGVADAPATGADDIPDPFGASLLVARSTVVDIAGTVDAALRALGVRADATAATGPTPSEPGRHPLVGSEPGAASRT